MSRAILHSSIVKITLCIWLLHNFIITKNISNVSSEIIGIKAINDIKETKMTSSIAEESFEYTPQHALLLSYDLNILIKKKIFPPSTKRRGR